MSEAGPIDTGAERALIELVRQTARCETLPRFRRIGPGHMRSKAAADDLVTDADLAAERRITDGVAQILPHARVIGEEAVAETPGLLDHLASPGVKVLVDPIDGTWNYAHGIAVFGTILAVVADGVTQWGLLYDPVFDDWVVAHKGGGAWYGRPDGQSSQLMLDGDAPEAAVALLPLYLFEEDRRHALARTMLARGRATSWRCSCHEYRTVLFGGATSIVNAGLKPWDHAAGVLAVEEAGGSAQLLDGRAYKPTFPAGTLIVARNMAEIRDVSAAYRSALL